MKLRESCESQLQQENLKPQKSAADMAYIVSNVLGGRFLDCSVQQVHLSWRWVSGIAISVSKKNGVMANASLQHHALTMGDAPSFIV